MKTKACLLAGAAVVAVAVAGPAEARVAHRAHHAAAPAISADDLRALRSEVEALRAEVQQMHAAQDATQAQAQQASAQAAAATQQAQAATTQATAAQTQVASASAAVPHQVETALNARPHTAWFDNTSISGRMYFNGSFIHREVNGRTVDSQGGFDIKRFYLSVDHRFNNMFSADLTMDVSNVVGGTSNYNFAGGFPGGGSVGSTGGTGSNCDANAPGGTSSCSLVGRGFYIKKAYLQIHLNPALEIRLGSADLPWVPYVESLYGYRYVENVFIDRTNFGTSADWGVHVAGTFANGLITYAISAIDGGGYRNPEFSNAVDIEGRLSLHYHNFDLAVGGYTGQRGQNLDLTQSSSGTNGNPATGAPIAHHTASRFDALASYGNAHFRIGGEYFYANNWNRVTQVTGDTSDGWSVFGNFNITPRVAVFGRYDLLRPSRDLTPNLEEHYYNAGIQFTPYNNINFALVYKHDLVDNGFFNTQDAGIVGGLTSSTGRGTYDEVGLYGQFRF